jgi:glycolate oxidase iron-sulfur subunit
VSGTDKEKLALTPLQEATEAANICAQCGACMSVCPVYQVGRREDMVARGKLRLLKGLDDGVLEADRHLQKTLGSCLLCGRCSDNCPNFTPAREGVQAGRAAVAAKAGVPFSKRLLLEEALPQPRCLDAAATAGFLGQKIIPPDSGLLHRLTGLEGLERLPGLAKKPFLHETPAEVTGPKGAPRVAFFVGCVANYMRPDLARRAVSLLAKRFNVIIPKTQGCCGLPAIAAGLTGSARKLAQRHSDLFNAAKVDMVITACGSCAHTLAKEMPNLLGQTGNANRLGGKVREISQVLAEETALLDGLQLEPGLAGPVAVHDPCHLKIGMGVSEEPRHVLRASGVDLAEMNGADQCCGGGGLFAVNEPGLSAAIFDPRSKAFGQSGAQILATSCSGCAMQWRRGLNPNYPVIHPIELLRV